MAWTAPKTWSVGELVTAANMNTHIRDDLKYLKGQAGQVDLEANLTLIGTATDATFYNRGLATFYTPGNLANAGGIACYKSRGTSGSPATVANGDFLGSIGLGGHDGTNWLTTAAILAKANGTVAAGSIPTDMIFTTDSASNTFTEKMRLTSAGRLGINRSSPQGIVHAYDTISGCLKWEYDGIDGTARTVLPDAAGDVVGRATFLYVIVNSAPTPGTAAGLIATSAAMPGGADIDLLTDVDGNIFSARFNANGSVDVRRRTTGGTARTAKVALWMLWI
jgi:hypothetical protein